jgi:superfamily II DNA or RNA helicase
MVKLVINTHYTFVHNLDSSLTDKLDYRFAVPVPNYWFSPAYKGGYWDGRIHFYSKKYKAVNTGLFRLLTQWLDEQSIPYTTEDKRKPLLQVDPVSKLADKDFASEQYSYQFEAVKQCLEYGCGVVEIAVNGGKTAIAAAVIKSLGLKTLFIVPTKELRFQTAREFRLMLPDTNIVEYASGVKAGDVTVALFQSLHRIKDKNWFNQFDVVLADESHKLPAKTFEAVMKKCPARYRIGFSGTAFGDTEVRDYTLMAHTGPRLIKVRSAELIERGVSAKPKVVFLKSESEPIPERVFHKAARFGVTYNESRNNQIINLILKLRKKGDTILVLTPYKRHGYELYNSLEGSVSPLYYNHGGVPDFIRKQNLESFKEDGGVMFGTSVLDEGIDVSAINSLILAYGGKKERRILQRVGRALRKKEGENIVHIYDFWDWHNKFLIRHSYNRLKVYLNEGFEVEGHGNFAEEMEKLIAEFHLGEPIDDDGPDPEFVKKVTKRKSGYVNRRPNMVDKIRAKFREVKGK